jgi:hypothetical protein
VREHEGGGGRAQTNLAGLGISDGGDKGAEFVAHGLGCNTGSGCFEVDVASTADTGIVGVAARHERSRHVEDGGRRVDVDRGSSGG